MQVAQQESPKFPPKTVQGVKFVRLALVSYTDPTGQNISQFAVVGDNTVMLLDSKEFVGAQERTPSGFASGWLLEMLLKEAGKASAPQGE